MSLDTLRQQILNQVHDCNADVAAIARYSQAEYRAKMEPGKVLPVFGPYDTPTEDGKAERQACIDRTVAKIRACIDAERADFLAHTSEPVSSDIVATVQIATSRDNISADELQALYDRYQDIRHLAMTIVERAHKDGIYIEHEPIVYADAESAKQVAASLTGKYDAGIMSDAAAEFYAACILDAYVRDPNKTELDTITLPPVPITPEAASLGASFGVI